MARAGAEVTVRYSRSAHADDEIVTAIRSEGGTAHAVRMLRHLPDGYKPEQVRDVLAAKIKASTGESRPQSASDTPKSRLDKIGASIGLLRQYFPKGIDLPIHSAEDLDWVAQELNDRPRKQLTSKSRSNTSATSCCDDRQNPPFGHR